MVLQHCEQFSIQVSNVCRVYLRVIEMGMWTVLESVTSSATIAAKQILRFSKVDEDRRYVMRALSGVRYNSSLVAMREKDYNLCLKLIASKLNVGVIPIAENAVCFYLEHCLKSKFLTRFILNTMSGGVQTLRECKDLASSLWTSQGSNSQKILLCVRSFIKQCKALRASPTLDIDHLTAMISLSQPHSCHSGTGSRLVECSATDYLTFNTEDVNTYERLPSSITVANGQFAL
ncbi:hypothetical protein ROZALSC1DRAFT_24827 [Rozella allomycis CSF55]|uniref:Uncharacterized protein n=1 Tax=Rozella allomycis (strain CSF55) TaxID=988480 RepID=A0A4P9YC50_ROZAC|nr:hypothetical protein ROZALSC1DRAFT_24827 [Rozella allomycis CSF55]